MAGPPVPVNGAGAGAGDGDGRCRCRGDRLGHIGHLPAAVADHRDRFPDRHRRAGLDEDLREDSAVVGLQLHRGLVGLDLGEHVTCQHGVTFVLEPLSDDTFGHGVGQAGHEDVGHGAPPTARTGLRRAPRR